MAEQWTEDFGIQNMDWRVIKKKKKKERWKSPTVLEDLGKVLHFSCRKIRIFWLKILTTIRQATEDDRSTVSIHSLKKLLTYS